MPVLNARNGCDDERRYQRDIQQISPRNIIEDANNQISYQSDCPKSITNSDSNKDPIQNIVDENGHLFDSFDIQFHKECRADNFEFRNPI